MKNILRKLTAVGLATLLLVPSFAVSAESTDGEKIASSTSTSQVTIAGEGQSSGSTKVPYTTLKAKVRESQKVNQDVRGWFYVPGSNMSMPIVIGKDNEYYINRTWAGVNYPNNNWKNWETTSTYLDYRVRLGSSWNKTSQNVVIYGHNWTNLKAPYDIGNYPQHKMFAQLASYNDIDYARKQPYVYFSTGEMEGVWKVFAVAYTEASPKNFPFNTPNPSAQQFQTIVKEWEQRSIFDFDVDVNQNDQILTLSTCTRHYPNVHGDQRFVVVARRLRPGETDNDPVVVSVNQNVKQPSFAG